MATRDHVFPKSKGGWRTVWACFTCNTMKGNLLPEEWRDFMAANPEWWKTGPKPFNRRRNNPTPKTKLPWVAFTASAEEVRALARRIVAEEFSIRAS